MLIPKLPQIKGKDHYLLDHPTLPDNGQSIFVHYEVKTVSTQTAT